MENKKLIDALHFRYATKEFDPTKKISKEDFDTLLESLRMAPSSFGLEPWKFLVIENPELRKKLRAAAWDQTQVTDSSHFIVLCARKDVDDKYIKNYVERIAKTRGIAKEQLSGYEEMMLGFRSNKSNEWMVDWSKRQTYIALGFLLEAAAIKGIDATPMEGFDPNAFDEILGLKGGSYTTSVLCCLGYRSKKDNYANLKKVRLDKKDVIEVR